MDSRTSPRIVIPPQVTGEVTLYQPMSILDLSIAGAQMETSVPLLNDSIHDFRLTLENRSVIVKGRVAYCQVGALRNAVVIYRCGVRVRRPVGAGGRRSAPLRRRVQCQPDVTRAGGGSCRPTAPVGARPKTLVTGEGSAPTAGVPGARCVRAGVEAGRPVVRHPREALRWPRLPYNLLCPPPHP